MEMQVVPGVSCLVSHLVSSKIMVFLEVEYLMDQDCRSACLLVCPLQEVWDHKGFVDSNLQNP